MCVLDQRGSAWSNTFNMEIRVFSNNKKTKTRSADWMEVFVQKFGDILVKVFKERTSVSIHSSTSWIANGVQQWIWLQITILTQRPTDGPTDRPTTWRKSGKCTYISLTYIPPRPAPLGNILFRMASPISNSFPNILSSILWHSIHPAVRWENSIFYFPAFSHFPFVAIIWKYSTYYCFIVNFCGTFHQTLFVSSSAILSASLH